jgi:hypothetical protein
MYVTSYCKIFTIEISYWIRTLKGITGYESLLAHVLATASHPEHESRKSQKHQIKSIGVQPEPATPSIMFSAANFPGFWQVS